MTRTLSQLLTSIHYKIELGTDVPESGDDDYIVRVGLINDWIHLWEGEEGVVWNELWSPSAGASGATLTTTADDATYALPTNFKFLGGYVRIVPSGGGASIYYKVLQTQEVSLKDSHNDLFVYVSGNPSSGYTLNFGPDCAPSATGDTIQYEYYKNATELSGASDKPEMSDPYFIIHGVISDLLAQEDPSESDKHFQIAQSRLKAMKTLNMTTPWYMRNGLPDLNNKLSGSAFGV